MITPARIRALVKARLGHLARHELVAEKFLGELTIGGTSFRALEAGEALR